MVTGLKEAIEEFLERQGMNKRQVFKTSKFFMGVLEDIEKQWNEKNNAIQFAEWIGEKNMFCGLSPDNVRRWHKLIGNSKAATATELYEQFKSL